ncbi:MAG TPA: ABC transporter substrate-binding protein, partial [Patescibacteria group bacterium]|nr:ABC transporter substrate-binding protein [Patescibacteria group bacterium]
KADVVIACLEKRLSVVSQQIKNLKRPSVVIIEWLDPLMVAGHWVPEMVERAGGNMLLSKRGEKSVEVSWEQILQTNPDVLIIAPCGFSISRTMEEIVLISQREGFKNLKAYKEKNIFLMDGDAYLTRPGPRVVDGIEILVDIFYSQRGESRHSENDWRRLL